ncbi:DUF4351 domain-containing protein [Cupriavidus respiraculi]|nr:DUF4351 domain-containing protein [Cupriavidus respiraculi]
MQQEEPRASLRLFLLFYPAHDERKRRFIQAALLHARICTRTDTGILYTGQRTWTAATDIAALIAQMPDTVSKYQPRLSYLLIDRNQYRQADLVKMNNLVACAIGLEQPASKETCSALIAQLRLMVGTNVPLTQVVVRWMRGLALRHSKSSSVPPVLAEAAFNNLKEFEMTWGHLFEQERQEGRQEGRKEGLQQGQALALRKLLVRRFGSVPPEIAGRIDVAAPEQLDVWLDRVFYVDSLAEVFRE